MRGKNGNRDANGNRSSPSHKNNRPVNTIGATRQPTTRPVLQQNTIIRMTVIVILE